MAQSITLTASMRSNLSSLKSIQSQMDKTQERLSTGKKVNSAIDNASSYYQARSLNNRAADLENLLDSMGQGIQTIEAANQGIESVTAYVEQLKSVAESAAALDPNSDSYDTDIESYRNQFNQIQKEITNLVKDSSYQGVNLLTGGNLTVTFNESRTHKFDIKGEDIVAGMNISSATAWEKTTPQVQKVTGADIIVKAAEGTEGQADYKPAIVIPKGTALLTDEGGTKEIAKVGNTYYEAKVGGTEVTTGTEALKPLMEPDPKGTESYAAAIENSMTEISKAVDYLRSYATTLGNNYSIIQTRQNFTENLVDVLETGADNLVLADMNEESANYLALQTRQQLAINSLSLASQSAQSVLSLF